jgi:hypothetical protein
MDRYILKAGGVSTLFCFCMVGMCMCMCVQMPNHHRFMVCLYIGSQEELITAANMAVRNGLWVPSVIIRLYMN